MFQPGRCQRKATIEREGKNYCGQHDPVAVAKKRKEREAAWDAEHDRKQKQWDEAEKRRQAIHRLCGHIPTDELDKYELKLR